MKGYWLILSSDIRDPQEQAAYGKAWGPIAQAYQARLLPPDETPALAERGERARVVMVEFPDLAAAQACFADPAYKAAAAHACAAADRELLIFAAEFPQAGDR